MRLSERGELGLLAELEQRGLARGIEHDAARLGANLVVTQDALVEGVHFRLDWTSWRELGFKAAAVNLSDLAASGAIPEGLLVTLGVPGDTALEHILELYEGLNEPGVPIVGGDTTQAPSVYLSVTAIGRSERVPGRDGARPGDLLVVTGPFGAAGAAFRGGGHGDQPPRPDRRSGKAVMPARRCGLRKAAAWPPSLTRCSTSLTASRPTRPTSRIVPGARFRSSSSASRSPKARHRRTSASARTTS